MNLKVNKSKWILRTSKKDANLFNKLKEKNIRKIYKRKELYKRGLL